jgi:hypothetical protein
LYFQSVNWNYVPLAKNVLNIITFIVKNLHIRFRLVLSPFYQGTDITYQEAIIFHGAFAYPVDMTLFYCRLIYAMRTTYCNFFFLRKTASFHLIVL